MNRRLSFATASRAHDGEGTSKRWIDSVSVLAVRRARATLLLLALAFGCNQAALGLPADAATPSATQVVCGKAMCDLNAGMFCCDDYVHGPRCVTTCPVGDWLKCDGPEDCPGAECCNSFGPSMNSIASCRPAGTDCQVGSVCHAGGDCPPGVSCIPINPDLYPGVGVCGG